MDPFLPYRQNIASQISSISLRTYRTQLQSAHGNHGLNIVVYTDDTHLSLTNKPTAAGINFHSGMKATAN